MRKVKMLLSFAVVVAAAALISFVGYLRYNMNLDSEIRGGLAENGVSVSGYSVRDRGKGLMIDVAGEDSVMSAEDVMLLRQVVNALRNSDLSYSEYYIRLVSPSGGVFHSVSYNRIKEYLGSEVDAPTIDTETYSFELKYLLADRNYGIDGLKFYDSVGCPDRRALYLELSADRDSAVDILETAYASVISLNSTGGGVQRLSIHVKDKGSDTIFMVSEDILYGDTIYWKGPGYSGLKTVFDN